MVKSKSSAKTLNGWINFYKPAGISSNLCLTKMKYLLGKPKIGHAGTLDPLAVGVLPVALGEATKVTSYLLGAPKTYRFIVSWGEQRTTDDAAGEVVAQSDLRPTKDQVLAIMPQFQGQIEQMPPQFSAKKIQGRPSYAMARKGEVVNLQKALIDIKDLQLLSHQGDTSEFLVTCSKGTYVRSLARDMGLTLGVYGYACLIERQQVGPFHIKDAISLEKLEIAEKNGILDQILNPLQAVLDDIPAVLVTPNGTQRLRQGQGIHIQDLIHPTYSIQELSIGRIAVYEDKALIALAELKGEELWPVRVFNL